MTTDTAADVERFFVAGLITCGEFQRSRFIVTKLNACFPKLYQIPEIRPMMDVEWKAFFTKLTAKYGGDTWAIKNPVVVFLNDEFLGDDVALFKHVSKKFRLPLKKDWFQIGKCHLRDHLRNIMDKFRQLAYLTVSINYQVVGTLLFELYNDLVPLTCENFLTKCKSEALGYVGTPIQRIMKNSWIQCGGWEIPEKHMRCENYVVPHDRRGVLCMCNNNRHKGNSVQYFITLAPTPWMDYKYVAFGQLIQGEEVLAKIEKVPTVYESPRYPIQVVKCGEVVFDSLPDYTTITSIDDSQHQSLQKSAPSALLDSVKNVVVGSSRPNVLGSSDAASASMFSLAKFKQGIYSLKTDLRSYYPCTLSDYLLDNDDIPEQKVSLHDDNIIIDDTGSDELAEPCQCRPFDDYLEPLQQSPGSSDITL